MTNYTSAIPNMIYDHHNAFPPQLSIANNSIVESRSVQLNNLIAEYRSVRKKHRIASLYYSVLYYLYFVPATILIASVSVLSFIIASNYVSNTDKQWIALATGIIGIIIEMMHTLMNGFGIQIKKEAFKLSHFEYNEVVMDLEFYQYNELSVDTIIDKVRNKVNKINKRNKNYLPCVIS